MKRYEAMTKEEIVKFATDCGCRSCTNCPAYEIHFDVDSTFDCIYKYLTAELPIKKRWQTIESDEDVMKIANDFDTFCYNHDCEDCLYNSHKSGDCFVGYLCKEIEVTD